MPEIDLWQQRLILSHLPGEAHDLDIAAEVHVTLLGHEEHEPNVVELQSREMLGVVDGDLSEAAIWIPQVAKVYQNSFLCHGFLSEVKDLIILFQELEN